MQLPVDFSALTRQMMGASRFEQFMAAFDDEPPVSIRTNPLKWPLAPEGDTVPWCPLGLYLDRRPNFTFDPLFHAGCYYVQEAASMFVHHVVSSLDTGSLTAALDLCAAPGGKSTALRAVLPADCLLLSNEPVRQRAQVLSENIQKWGHPESVVSNNYPRDIRRAGLTFDLILCDVPCSGEGMFRRDPETIGEWSLAAVKRCRDLQREIVAEAWQCLRQGGLFIYSTCTYNIYEDEENVAWMQQELGAEVVEVPIGDSWGITGSLLAEFSAPVYRFIPGITRSEGLFVAVMRKGGNGSGNVDQRRNTRALQGLNIIFPTAPATDHRGNHNAGRGETKKDVATTDNIPTAELSYDQAIGYLRRQAIVLSPEAPRGLIRVCFQGHPLGLVKNIGSRANNLYPKEWAIKTTHVPTEYRPVITDGRTSTADC